MHAPRRLDHHRFKYKRERPVIDLWSTKQMTETGIKWPTSSLRKFSTRLDVRPINGTLTNGALLHMYNKRNGRADQCAIKIASIRTTSLFYVAIDVKLDHHHDKRTNCSIQYQMYNTWIISHRGIKWQVSLSTLRERVGYVPRRAEVYAYAIPEIPREKSIPTITRSCREKRSSLSL